jgi:hypothetical protein
MIDDSEHKKPDDANNGQLEKEQPTIDDSEHKKPNDADDGQLEKEEKEQPTIGGYKLEVDAEKPTGPEPQKKDVAVGKPVQKENQKKNKKQKDLILDIN